MARTKRIAAFGNEIVCNRSISYRAFANYFSMCFVMWNVDTNQIFSYFRFSISANYLKSDFSTVNFFQRLQKFGKVLRSTERQRNWRIKPKLILFKTTLTEARASQIDQMLERLRAEVHSRLSPSRKRRESLSRRVTVLWTFLVFCKVTFTWSPSSVFC